METFHSIRHSAFRNYKAFEYVIAPLRSSRYNCNLEPASDGTAWFDFDGNVFSVLPVLSSRENVGSDPNVIIFGPEHPTHLDYPLLSQTVSELHLLRSFRAPQSTAEGGATDSFKFSYRTTALVCDKVKGKTFCSTTLDNGTMVFLVILGAKNNSAKKLLKDLEDKKTSITDEMADKWYHDMFF